MREVFIYALCDKTGVKYIGKSVKPKNRLRVHIFGAITDGHKEYNYPKSIWIRENLEDIYQITIEICNDENWEKRERYWIKFYKELGGLTNQRPGGTGWHGHINTPEQIQKAKETKGDFKHSEATKAHMSKIRKGKPIAHFEGMTVWNKDKPWSPEMREKLREAHIGQIPWNKGKKGEYTTSWKGGHHSEATILKLKSVEISDELRQIRREMATGRKATEESKKRRSEFMKASPSCKRPTINIETGIIHNSLKEAYDTYPSINKRWGYSFVAEMVLDEKRNKTFLMYA